jgi:L-amino acid N-acyltransferase YncA
MLSLRLRSLRPDDLPAITHIYAHHVRNSCSSFELEAPSEQEMRARAEAILAAGWPYVVAQATGPGGSSVLGYAYAGPYRPRLAYRMTVEDSIYVAPGQQGMGIGRWLLAEVIARAAARGARQMIAVVGDPDRNAGSLALHRRLGFVDIGVLPAVGWKHGGWRSSAFLQRSLGPGQQQAGEA